MESEIILYGSEDAAKYVTNISGWVDRNGRFFGEDKHMAMYSGCTHRPCDVCQKPVEKLYIKCDKCRKSSELQRYENREVVEWGFEIPVYSEYLDQFFLSNDDVEDYLYDEIELTFDDLRLVLCNPIYLHPIDTAYWLDDLPEEVELSENIQDLLNELNSALREEGPVSWTPGKYAAVLPR